jgi:Pvc16 N-terminal domain
MSNYLAIATVTAALQRLLQEGIQEDVPGATVTTVRPDNPGTASQTVGINIYLYQATPNPAWRNADLRTRRPKGDLIKHGQAALDLHYLLTFYGNEQALEPQRLMGSAIRTLVDQPTLTQDIIQDTIEQSNLTFLSASTLGDQVQLVQFIPSSVTTEDLSRIWSVFFQIPYSLSFAFQGTAVLIQGEKSGKTALPVRKREFYVAPIRPVIDKVKLEQPRQLAAQLEDSEDFEDLEDFRRTKLEPLSRSSNLVIVIKGRRLRGERTIVRIGRADITPQKVTDEEVRVQLSLLNLQESSLLRAGVQGVQVVHQFQGQTMAPDSEVESNVMPLVVCPKILNGNEGVAMLNAEAQDEDIYRGNITAQIDVTLTPEQRVFLLLNGIEASKTYIFRAARRTSDMDVIRFSVQDLIAGTYLVRVQVDGAESPLLVDREDQYVGPIVTVP